MHPIFIVLLIILAWWVSGYYSFKYWGTHEFDFTKTDKNFALGMGFVLGPIAFLMGAAMHTGSDTIITPKRTVKRQTHL